MVGGKKKKHVDQNRQAKLAEVVESLRKKATPVTTAGICIQDLTTSQHMKHHGLVLF